jgi:hypothetical protein
VESAHPFLSLALSILSIAPFTGGVALGLHGLLLPERRPNFNDWYRRRYPRHRWSEANYVRFTRIVSGSLLALSLLYGFGVVFLFRSLL